MSQQTKNIGTILNHDDSLLGQLVGRAKALVRSQQQMDQVLGSAFKGRYKLGTYEKGILSLLTDNASTATELRYKVPELLSLLRQDPNWVALIKIQVKVHHHWHHFEAKAEPVEPPPPSAPLSEQTIKSFEVLIQQLSADKEHQALVDSLNKIIKANAQLKKE